MWIEIVFLVGSFCIVHSYKPNPTQYICIDNSTERSQTLPSCLPGYVVEIDNVIYESTRDQSCSGITQCQIENKNSFLFACNRKRTCQIDLSTLAFHINSTCGTTKRFFVQYRCLPVIQEQKDFLCESFTSRRPSLSDINLSCLRNYRLHITKASIGVSLKSQQDEFNPKNRFKCNRETETVCVMDVPAGYREICRSQSKQECKISYNQRPTLNNCPYGTASNFSYVEYSCIPGKTLSKTLFFLSMNYLDETILEDLPRVDICSNLTLERLTVDRGLLHSPQGFNDDVTCRKELFIPRQSRLRIFMLDQSLEVPPQLKVQLGNQIRTLAERYFVDLNITNVKRDELLKFEWKNNPTGENGQFLLYFQGKICEEEGRNSIEIREIFF